MEQFYTRAQVKELLQLSQAQVDRLIAARKIRAIKIGRLVRIPASALTEFIEKQAS